MLPTVDDVGTNIFRQAHHLPFVKARSTIDSSTLLTRIFLTITHVDGLFLYRVRLRKFSPEEQIKDKERCFEI